VAFVCCNGRFGSSPVTISGRCLADRVHERSPSRTWFPSCVDRAGDVTRQFTYGWLRPLMVGHRAVVAFLEREIENQKPRPVPGLNVDSKTKVTLARVARVSLDGPAVFCAVDRKFRSRLPRSHVPRPVRRTTCRSAANAKVAFKRITAARSRGRSPRRRGESRQSSGRAWRSAAATAC